MDASGKQTLIQRRLKSLLDSLEVLGACPEQQALSKQFLEEVASKMAARGGSVYIVDKDELVLAHALDPGHAPERLSLPRPSNSVIGRAMRERKPMMVADIKQEDNISSSGWSGYQDAATLVIPLISSDGNVMGVASVHNRTEPEFAPGDYELSSLLARFGNTLLDLAQEQLARKTSEEQYRRLLELAQEGIVSVDADERITYANPTFARLMGYEVSELKGMSFVDLCEAGSQERILEGTARRRRGVASHYELNMRTRSGDTLCFQLAASPMFDATDEYEGALGVLTDITERQQAQQALKASEQKYRRYIENAPHGVLVLDDRMLVTETNPAARTLIGVEESELSGRQFASLLTADQQAELEMLVAEVRQHKTASGEFFFVSPHRGRLPVWIDCVLLDEGRMLVFATDLTELRQTQEDLAEQHAYLANVFAALTEQVCVVDREGLITDANPAFCEQFNLRRKQLGQVRLSSLYDAGDREDTFRRDIQTVFASGSSRRDTRNLRCGDDRRLRILDISLSPLTGMSDNIEHVVIVIRDITEQKEMEQQVYQAQRLEAIGRLSSGIAHDFNNILAAIMGSTELAMDSLPDSSPVMLDLRETMAGAQRARSLVRQILTFGRGREAQREPIRAGAVINEVLALMRATLPATIGIETEFATDDDTIFADASQMHQVMMNLCTNAGQALKTTGGTLKVRVEKKLFSSTDMDRLSLLKPGEHICIQIIDNGCGIEPSKLAHIFEPFYTTRTDHGGSGLGLSVVHGIITSHGGAIAVDSNVNSGTTVSIYLPYSELQPVEQVSSDTEEIQARGHVLFVDDEPSIVVFSKRMLLRMGFEVTAFTSSKEALSVFQAAPEKFDILVTDQTMPEMTGAELAQSVMQLRPEFPVVMCTGYSDVVPPKVARELGIAEYIMKPYDGQQLGKAIVKQLRAES